MTASEAAQLQRGRWLLHTIRGLRREIMNAIRNDKPELKQLKSEYARLVEEFEAMPRWVREEVITPSIEAARQFIEAKSDSDEKAARLMRWVVSRSAA